MQNKWQHILKKKATNSEYPGWNSLPLSCLDICTYFRLFPAKTCSLHAWTFACSLVFPIGTREDQTTSMIRLVSIVCSFRPRSQLSLFFKPVQLSTPTLTLFDGHLTSSVAEMKRLYCRTCITTSSYILMMVTIAIVGCLALMSSRIASDWKVFPKFRPEA